MTTFLPDARARRAAALIVGVVMSLVLVAARPTAAAPQEASFALQSGSFAVGEIDFELPAEGGLTGTLDDETGELTGTLLLPPVAAEPFPGVGVTISFAQVGEGIGAIDPETGEATFDAAVVLGIEAPGLIPPGCEIGPVDMTFEGAFDAESLVLVLSDSVVLPPATGCGDLGPVIDGFLGGETLVELTFVQTDEPIDPPVDPVDPVDPVEPDDDADDDDRPDGPGPAAPATPISGEARFTG